MVAVVLVQLKRLQAEVIRLKREFRKLKERDLMSHANLDKMVATRSKAKAPAPVVQQPQAKAGPVAKPAKATKATKAAKGPKVKSAVYMKKYRADPANRDGENKRRILAKVRKTAGYKANIKTLQRYDIMPEEITVIRRERGYEPNDLYVTVADTKAAALKIQADNLKVQQALAKQIMANNKNAEELHKTLNVTMPHALKGKALHLPQTDKFTFSSLKAYFYEFEGTGRGLWKKVTLGIYFGAKGRTTTGQLYNVIHNHSPECAKHDTGFKHCFQDMEGLMDSIMEGEGAVSSKLKYLEVLSLTMRHYPPIDIDGEFKPQYDMLQKKIKEVQALAEARKLHLKDTQTITFKFSEMMELIKKHFGANSLQYLFMLMYDEFPARDDFGALTIKTGEHKLTEGTDKIWTFDGKAIPKAMGNFLNINTKKKTEPVQIVFQDYKTENLYGLIVHSFSKGVSNLIRKLGTKETLFGNAKLTTWVRKILIESGVKTLEDTKKGSTTNVGNLNLLRHAYISEALSKAKVSEEERVLLAKRMKHSPIMSAQYVRHFVKKLDEIKDDVEEEPEEPDEPEPEPKPKAKARKAKK